MEIDYEGIELDIIGDHETEDYEIYHKGEDITSLLGPKMVDCLVEVAVDVAKEDRRIGEAEAAADRKKDALKGRFGY